MTGKQRTPEEEVGRISRPLLGFRHQRDPVFNSEWPRGGSIGATLFQTGHQVTLRHVEESKEGRQARQDKREEDMVPTVLKWLQNP